MLNRLLVACLLIITQFVGWTPNATAAIHLNWELVASGLVLPILVTNAGDGSGRLFVVEQTGRIRIIGPDGTPLAVDFLNLGSTGLNRVAYAGDERGLLGLAFHPDYKNNDRFFVNYTRLLDSATVIAEYQVSTLNPDVASPIEKPLLVIPQPAANHNGGNLAFGPDGYLYIGMGDGGGGGDTYGNGQNIDTLLGAILRIDVDSGNPYGIPPDNPFAGATPGLGEIYAYGTRNPWRFSFDRLDGCLFVGDVGQDLHEEIDLVEKGDNLGWNIMEGLHCYSPSEGCDMTGLKLPIADLDRSLASAITGGFVYRGSKFPSLYGLYIFADYTSGRMFSLEETAPGVWVRGDLPDTDFTISSFGEDEAGELYFTHHLGGEVYHLIDASADLDNDNQVDAIDLLDFAHQAGGHPPETGFKPANLNGDSGIGFKDFALFQREWHIQP